MTSISTIAAIGNSTPLSFFASKIEKPAEVNEIAVTDAQSAPELSSDTVKVKKTDYPTEEHAETFVMDLHDPDNLKPDTAVYEPKTGMYKVGTMLGDKFISQPWQLSPDEYLKWSERKSFNNYFKTRNDSLFTSKGKDKFDFSDMHFDLGPAEKIFGPGGVQLKTQGSAELKFGYNYKFTDNPSLTERNRTTKAFDFDEKINARIDAKIGDKMDFNVNYNTEATFDIDSKNLKLAYEGKEDEIVKLLEAGNISFPTNSTLIKGASTLFGIRTDLQFGKLKLQTVFSQKKTKATTVGSKGGSTLSMFEIQAYDYDENRHFFLAQYFRDTYNRACATLPNITSGITINRVEIWVTNNGGTTENTRNVIGFVDLAEQNKISNPMWQGSGTPYPSNGSNNLYSTIVSEYADARITDKTSATLDQFLVGGVDYEKIENARLLKSSEYTLNKHLGYVSLSSQLQTNQILAVAFEYTYNGQTFQVGEFSADQKDNDKAIIVKLLKNTSNSPKMGNWDLMMKNVYSLNARSLQKEKFKLDIKYLSDTTGVNLSYIPEEHLKQTTLLKMMNLDRLDDNMKTNPNGKFDYIEGYTVQSQSARIIFPVVEPFGDWLRSKIGNDAVADRYCYDELYDSTKTTAKQIAEKNKFTLTGEYKSSGGSEIETGQTNIPRGSVVVTAGGVTLVEGTDYSVDYASGRVTILNQSIIDAGTNVSVSLESADDFSMMRKTMMGVNWDYDFTKNFSMGGTFLTVSEKPQTSKVRMGEEPLNNTIWGLHLNWKQQSQWLTNMIDKLPFIEATAPSSISFTGEYAQLNAGTAHGTQGHASYIDNFDDTKNPNSIADPKEWVLASTPSHLEYGNLTNDVKYGYNRSLLAWYNIDPLFTRRSSSLTPGHIKSDLNQLSNHYVREVYVREIYPNRDTNSGESNTLPVLNMAYYPSERGPYNLDPDLDRNGHLNNPAKRWGGMMRKIDASDFETSNVQYIEFWMLDPFIYTKGDNKYGGELYINLGDVSEDVLKDGKKAYESGMPVSSASTYAETTWGRVPSEKSVVYSFSNESGARPKQDIGLNGLNDTDERNFSTYADYLQKVKGKVSEEVYDSLFEDPAGDDYHYFRGSDFDAQRTSILDRYKRINGLEGNSPNTSESSESYSTAYKASPDAEDVNGDYTMNEYENFFEYHVSIHPNDLQVGRNYIVDSRKYNATLRNGEKEEVMWYQFRIPVDEFEKKIGSINDFSSIRFMRMYMTGFEEPIVLRFANLDLVRGEWRTYKQPLYTGERPNVTGTIVPSAVNIEENNDKSPVNYVLPPGISRVLDPDQRQLNQQNEQSLALTVENLGTGDARAVYKTMNLDLRRYKHLQMFAHANALEGDDQLQDNQMSMFVRIGSDYKSNYYEYEIPLKITPAGRYDTFTTQGCKAVWPEENMLDINFKVFTDLKHERNKKGDVSYTKLFSKYDDEKPNNKISIMGNPSLGEVKTIMIGIRNNGRKTNSVEVWVNELRLQEFTNEGGYAAQGNLNVQLSDLGTLNLTGHTETAGFGGLEENVNQRRDDNLYEWGITTQFELGKFFPEKWKMTLPLYYSYSWQKISPKYNPFDTDMLQKDALDECATSQQRDSLSSLTESVVKNKNFSLSNWKSQYQSRKPMPYDPNNFNLSYSYSQRYKTGETTVYENEENWKFNLGYNYSPKYTPLEPFKNMKAKTKWLDLLKAQNLQWLPQRLTFNTDITRNYYEFQERDIDAGTQLPVVFSEQFLWNRDLTVQWDIFKSLKMSWTSATHAEIEEPYTVVNKDLYPDEYAAWKDSVKRSLMSFGRPLTYKSTFTGSYQVPLNKIPILDWVTADGSYNANYNWTRGTELEDGTSLGHTISSQRTVNLNGRLNFETLYKKVPFLADVEKRFSGNSKNNSKNNKNNSKNNTKNAKDSKNSKDSKDAKNSKDSKDAKDAKGKDAKSGDGKDGGKDANSKKTKGFTQEVTLNDSVATEIKHGQNSKRISVRATTEKGKTYNLKFSKVDANTIKVKNLDTIPVKISVVAKEPLENLSWYKTSQVAARALMMVRNVSMSYRNTYALTLPGFSTEVGDAFGQKSKNGALSPGLDFAFGAIGDSYIDKAARNGWLMQNDSNITTPATSNSMEDLQLKATLEPFRDFKIDLNASRTVNKANSVQFMYSNMPVTQSGSFNMTVISASSAFESTGSINNNYHSKHFEKFLKNLPIIQGRLERKYANTTYPAAAGQDWAGKPYSAENGGVGLYSGDVMIPAFLSAYCGTDAVKTPLDIFPALSRIMPNWSVKYSGLTKLVPWLGDNLKSFNINHGYKSVFSIGAYNSYSNFMEYMGDFGFITDVTTGNPIPSSMYNVSTVSINESFSPLIGVDATLNNGLSAKIEYKKTRTLNLSMTSVALTENFSNDIVVGMGYKIKDLNLFGAKSIQSSDGRKSKSKGKNSKEDDKSKTNSRTTSRTRTVSHDLNIRFDFSYKMQSALNRNIQTAITTATSGSTAYKLTMSADYTFSRLLTLSGFFDWNKNLPLVSQSSYPTTTADFGISMKFSLTR